MVDHDARDVWRDEFNATLHALSALQDAYLALLRQVYRMQRRIVNVKARGEREVVRVEAKQDAESGGVYIVFDLACPPVNRWFRRNSSYWTALDADYQMQVLWIELAQQAAEQLGNVRFSEAAMVVRFVVGSRADADAFDYVLKYIIDGLRAAAILCSDASGDLLHLIEVEVGKPERVEVLLWDITNCTWAQQVLRDREALKKRALGTRN